MSGITSSQYPISLNFTYKCVGLLIFEFFREGPEKGLEYIGIPESFILGRLGKGVWHIQSIENLGSLLVLE